MGIFSAIRDAILPGRDKQDKPATSSRRAATAPRPAGTTVGQAGGGAKPAAKPQPMAEVDVEKRLDAMAGADKLNWRTSIVDLMKLIGVDSSLGARKELAQELGYSGALDGSAEMNTWLHRRTMQELGKHGGKVPKQFLD